MMDTGIGFTLFLFSLSVTKAICSQLLLQRLGSGLTGLSPALMGEAH